jgi:hypothetical protein
MSHIGRGSQVMGPIWGFVLPAPLAVGGFEEVAVPLPPAHSPALRDPLAIWSRLQRFG